MIRLLRYIKDRWWLALLAMLCIGLNVYFEISLPNFMSRIATIMQNPTGYYLKWEGLIPAFGHEFIAPTRDHITDTWIISGIMMSFSVAGLMMSFAASLSVSYVGAHFGRNLRHAVFAKVANLSLDQCGKFGTASLITRTTNDIEQCQQMLQGTLRTSVRAPATLIIAIIMVLTKDTGIALILAVSVPIIMLAIAILFVKAVPLFTKMQTLFDKVTLVFREGLTGVRVIRAFNQEKKEKKRFEEASWEASRTTIKFGRLMSFGEPIINLTFNITFIGIYFYGYKKFDGGTWNNVLINYSGIIASAEYAMEIMFAFLMFSFLLIMWPRASVCAKRINAVLDEPLSIPEPEEPKQPESSGGLIEFDHVTFSFPDADAPSLKDITFTAKAGSTTAIIGSTGSGKSSVINLIPRFYDVSEGSIKLNGLDVREYATKDLRGRIGFVPQQALLFKGTIRSNMLFGNPGATEEDIEKALDVAQATHFVSQKEAGLDSEVEQGGKNFSGGQKQRLCIARALVRKAEVYIFDDAFSALDFRTDTKLRFALKEYIKDASIIIVAQRVSTILDADNIVVLNEGKIVGQGKHKDLMENCEVYREIVYSQLDPDEVQKTLRLEKQFQKEGGVA